VYPEARQALEMNAACSYWISCRRRVHEQLVVWQNEASDGSQRLGAILPQVITAGTVTRRAVEATWMTARYDTPLVGYTGEKMFSLERRSLLSLLDATQQPQEEHGRLGAQGAGGGAARLDLCGCRRGQSGTVDFGALGRRPVWLPRRHTYVQTDCRCQPKDLIP